MTDQEGGYDCEFVEKPPEAIQSECPVCQLVLREPYQAICAVNVTRDFSAVSTARTLIHIMKMSPPTTGLCVAITQCHALKV